MKKILNIAIIALCIVLFFQTVFFVKYVIEDKWVYNLVSSEEDLFNRFQYQDYDSLLDAVYQNEARNVAPKGDMEALYAVAYYYENAMMYQAYKTVGDMPKANERHDKMAEYESQMGEYSFAKEEILDYLGIE